ncbi:transglutaminase-like domain-containing protein [Blastococcus sp. DSM 46792]|uniref:Transglutaminase-like domain-containing protein n=1 Tax=Blastococcus goldschmidtiae TaxID=3075546 RepID=A0ABU2K6M3_9ACTN|nr:transglutaminase-like domain-containing protein [Blastococcus sp. DSM 46792]
MPAKRFTENQIRPAGRLVEILLSLDRAPLVEPRRAEFRVVGTCRHFAVLACALLRSRGIPSRVRCGFATYFQPGQALDHWIVEYQDGDRGRWVRIDPEILGGDVLEHPDDLRPGEFLDAAEAWRAYRRGDVDATVFGVHGTENFGPAEIRGNLVRDLASVNKTEMLPWDEWGRMTEAYAYETGPDYDELLDAVAAALVAEDLPAATALYRGRSELTVPQRLLHPGA